MDTAVRFVGFLLESVHIIGSFPSGILSSLCLISWFTPFATNRPTDHVPPTTQKINLFPSVSIILNENVIPRE